MADIRLEAGDCREVLRSIILCGGGPPGLRLNCGIRLPVARLAQGHEVLQRVRRKEISEQSKRDDVMHIVAGHPAVLAGVGVAFPCLPLLRRPVRPAVALALNTEVLRMQRPNARRIAAGSRAVFTLAGRPSCMAGRSGKFRTAPHAYGPHGSIEGLGDGRVLAGGGTRTAPAVSQPGRGNGERGAAALADEGDRCSHASNMRRRA